MDKVTIVRKCLKREEWKTLIQECHASGMTVTAWCKTNGIVEQTYYRNLKKIREELISDLPAPKSSPECTKPAVFKKLEVQSPTARTNSAVIIRLPGATLEISEGTSQQTVQAVLLALQNIC